MEFISIVHNIHSPSLLFLNDINKLDGVDDFAFEFRNKTECYRDVGCNTTNFSLCSLAEYLYDGHYERV